MIILQFPSSVHLPSFLLNLKMSIFSRLLSFSFLLAHEITLSICIHTKAVTNLYSDFLLPGALSETPEVYVFTCAHRQIVNILKHIIPTAFPLACTIRTSNSICLKKKSWLSFWNLPFFLCFLLRNESTIYSNPWLKMSNLSWFWSIINYIQLLIKSYLFSYFNIM